MAKNPGKVPPAIVAGNAGARADLSTVSIMKDGKAFDVAYNVAESPLASIFRCKSKDGAAYITADEFEAGERLRADFTRGQLAPRLGIDWEMAVSSGGRAHGGAADISDSAMAARLRVNAAMTTVGPELAGVLVDVCCFLKGLQLVERERQWPVRSAKVMLKAALSALARHYNPQGATRRTRTSHHWGAADYKPVA